MSNIKYDILECVPDGITLREGQKEFLLQVQDSWNELDVIVGDMPVAFGKSLCCITIGRWCAKNNLGNAAALTPTTILQDQYSRDFPTIPMLKGASHYNCLCNPKVTCEKVKEKTEKYCSQRDETLQCNYMNAKDIAAMSEFAIFNFHSISVNRMWKPVMIIDEGHNAENHILGRFGMKIWTFELETRGVKLPDNIALNEDFNGSKKINKDALLVVMNDYAKQIECEYKAANSRIADLMDTGDSDKLCKALKAEFTLVIDVIESIKSDPESLLMLMKSDRYFERRELYKEHYGRDANFIYIKPLSVHKLAERYLWPEKIVNKIIFLSATFNETDIKTLGLSGRRWKIFKGKHPIPVNRREIRIWPVASMTYKNRKEGAPKIAVACLKLAEKHHDTKGVIHCTYDVANELKTMSFHNNQYRRFIFHNKDDKTQVYEKFLKDSRPVVLVASGMSEGIDLAGLGFGWQVITMVIRPNISDDVNFWRLKYDKEKYDWETIKVIEQASGRISRHKDDLGYTYIITSDFCQFWEHTYMRPVKSGRKTFWADWFAEALKWHDGINRS